MYELRDRTGVIASGSLERIRAKVSDLTHADKQADRARNASAVARSTSVRAAVDQYLTARASVVEASRRDSEANKAFREATDNDGDFERAALQASATHAAFVRAAIEVEQAARRLLQFERDELDTHDDLVEALDLDKLQEACNAQ